MTKDNPTTHYSGSEFFSRSGLPLSVLMIPLQHGHLYHDHDVSELVVVRSGRGLHATRREEYPIESGNVFVVREGEEHAYLDTSELSICNVLFDLEKLNLPLESLSQTPGYSALFSLEPLLRETHGVKSHLKLSSARLAVVLDLLSSAYKEQEEKHPGFECMAAALFMQVVGFLSRSYSTSEDPESRSVLRLSRVLDHMADSFNQPLRLEELAELANMSLSTFQRIFRRTLHSSPGDYLIRLRIQRACQLLSGGEKNITEVAVTTGFTDSNYFSRQFRRVMGVSPSDYRRKAGGPG